MIKKVNIVKDPLFSVIGRCADELQINAFVIGGWVRDQILSIKKEVYHY